MSDQAERVVGKCKHFPPVFGCQDCINLRNQDRWYRPIKSDAVEAFGEAAGLSHTKARAILETLRRAGYELSDGWRF